MILPGAGNRGPRAEEAGEKPDPRASGLRRAEPQERVARPDPHHGHRRWTRPASGATDAAARPGACSATTSGSPTCRRRLGRRARPLPAARRARRQARASSPTSSGRCRASSARRTPTRWAATTVRSPSVQARAASEPTSYERDGRAVPDQGVSSRGDFWNAEHGPRSLPAGRNVSDRRHRRRHQRPSRWRGDSLPAGALSTAPARRCSSTLQERLERRAPCSVQGAAATRRRPLPRVGRDQPRDTCTSETKGRVGYLHIPDMGPRGFAEFHRAFLTECDRDGAGRRRPLQRRRPRLAAAAREAGPRSASATTSRDGQARAVSALRGAGPDRGAHQRVRRLRRRHLQPLLQAAEARPARRQADLGRRGRHLRRGTRSSTAR